jgi:hypothetical protein
MPRWTPESRQRQRELIQTWQPWQNSTGPQTEHGTRMSSLNNPYSGSEHGYFRALWKRGKKRDLDALAQLLAGKVKPKTRKF